MEKIKAIFCILFGHSRIVNACFGQITCARCDDLLGDTLMGTYDMTGKIVMNHDCSTCHANYKTLTWKDKFLTPNPFKL